MNTKSIFLEFICNNAAKYIAIDQDGAACTYVEKPTRNDDCWYPKEIIDISLFIVKCKPPEDWTKELYLIKDDGTLERVEK